MAVSPANVAMTELITHPNEKGEGDSVSTGSLQSKEVIFEEYLYYAAIQRLEEEGDRPQEGEGEKGWFYRLSDYKGKNVNVDVSSASPPPMTPKQEDDARASRALRLASWMSVFYLITTDILGPFNAPFAISQVGWVPGAKKQCAISSGGLI